MWFKQAASSVWNKAKTVLVDQRTPGRRLLDQIFESQEEIIPNTKLTELASLTFDLEAFQEILDLLIVRIKVFKYDLDEAHKNLNMLIVINYLIKNGASAFVDQLRGYIPTFKKYQTLQELKTYEQQDKQSRLNYQLQKIKNRAQHIQTLLEDKKKLMKEKELAMLIKQKMKIFQKQKMDSISSNPTDNEHQSSKIKGQEVQQHMGKMQWYMQNYLWQYVDKIDGKLEEVSDKIMNKVDKFIVGEMPEQFQVQDQSQKMEEGEEESPAKMNKVNYQLLDGDGDDDLMRRLEEEIGDEPVGDSNLLEFEEIEDSPVKEAPKQTEGQELI